MKASRWLKSRLLLLSWAIALGIGALVVSQLLESRSAIWQRAQATNTNLLFTVSHVLERTLEGADHAILHSVDVLERAAHMAATDPLGGDRPAGVLSGVDTELLFAAVSSDGYGIQLVLDPNGRVVFSSRPPPPGEWVFNQRPYFRVHQRASDVGLYMGEPFLSSYDNQPSMAMSRRWNRPDGSFGGVVVQTMKLSVVHQLFSSFELGPDSGINVYLKDGSVVSRFPYTSEHLGSSMAGTPDFQRFLHEQNGGFRSAMSADGVDRLYVFRTLTPFPVIINVAQASHSILGAWQRNAMWLGGATLLLMFACVSLAVYAEKGLRAHRSTARRLRSAEHELRTIVDSLPVLIAYWDDQLVNRMSNVAHVSWLGMAPEQMVGRHLDELLDTDLRESIRPYVDAALRGEMQAFENILPDTRGVPRHAYTTFIPDQDQGRVKGFFVMVTDISQRKMAEAALVEEKERFEVILESINDGVITTSRDGRVLYLNPTAAAMTGWSTQEASGQLIEHVMRVESPDGRSAVLSPVREALRQRKAFKNKVESVLVSKDGERMHIENSTAPLLDEQGWLRGAVIVFHEVGQVRAMANKMTHLAQHDALTGLPNRRRFDMVGRDALKLAQTDGRYLAVLYLDLDGFKQVNDLYGHAVGDELLVAVTHRLSARLRDSDGLYRQGGDEFIVLMSRLGAPEDAEALATRLIESCQQPVSVSGKHLAVTVSIGIGVYPDDATDLAALILRADRAMYIAKNSGRNRYVRFDRSSARAQGGAAHA